MENIAVTRCDLRQPEHDLALQRCLCYTLRKIGVNIPLGRLASGESLEQKNAWLQQWLMEKIHERKVCFYREPVFVFDE